MKTLKIIIYYACYFLAVCLNIVTAIFLFCSLIICTDKILTFLLAVIIFAISFLITKKIDGYTVK
jgi:hypothetical protein